MALYENTKTKERRRVVGGGHVDRQLASLDEWKLVDDDPVNAVERPADIAGATPTGDDTSGGSAPVGGGKNVKK